MAQTPREIVKRCLEFNRPERMPRDLWELPWMEIHHPGALDRVKNRYPSDFARFSGEIYNPSIRARGNQHEIGEYTDEWGCVFFNLQKGIVGEVKNPAIESWEAAAEYLPPWEVLPTDREKATAVVNDFYASTDKFVLASRCAQPWERMQYLLGTENAMMEMLLHPDEFKQLLDKVHAFYLEELTFWAKTDVDGVMFADDWGSQTNLLIRPAVWREFFKPRYSEYCEVARRYGKKVFMHSDGCITSIYPDLIEIGVNAQNSQLFCMDMDKLAAIAKGKITFWGEIDRQHILTSSDLEEGRAAVRKVADALYSPDGGIIAQFELGPGANSEMAFAIYDEWEKVQGR